MNLLQRTTVVLCVLALAGCKFVPTPIRAQALKDSGAAEDMGDATRRADNYYWQEHRQAEEEQARRDRQAKVFGKKPSS